MTAAVVADRLTKRYGELVALEEVSFDVPAGQLVAVLGPNGAGKTTALEILEGYQAPREAASGCSAPIPAAAAGPGAPASGWCCSRPASTTSCRSVSC